MAKLRRKNITLSSNVKQSNLNDVDKFQLNDKKQLKNKRDNNTQQQNLLKVYDSCEENKNVIRRCKVKLTRIRTNQATSAYARSGQKLLNDDPKVNTDARRGYQTIKDDFTCKSSKSSNLSNSDSSEKIACNLNKNFENQMDKNITEDISKLRIKHNINKEIRIKLVKLSQENVIEQISNKIIDNGNRTTSNKFIELTYENQSNISKRTRRNKKLMIDKENESKSVNKKDDKLTNQNNDKFNTNEKRITRRKTILAEPKEKPEVKPNSVRKNKIITRKANSIKILDNNNLNNILHNTEITTNNVTTSNQKNSENIENTNNYNSIPIESITTPDIQKETFFRGLRINKMSNTNNKSEFELAKNIQTKQETQKNKTKNLKITIPRSKDPLFLRSAVENETKRKTKNHKRTDKNAENIETIDKIIDKENLLKLTQNKPKKKIEDKNNNQDYLDIVTDSKSDKTIDILKKNTRNLVKKDSKEKNLSIANISAILEEDFDDDNLNSERIRPKRIIFKSPLKDRKVVVGDSNNCKIFDFQSSQSDSDLSPNKSQGEKDIIKKLVKEGKVQVAKYRKGKGRLALKRLKKEKSTVTKMQSELNANKTDKRTEENQSENEYEFEDNHFGADLKIEKEKVLFSPEKNNVGYSPLARIAMNKQAKVSSITNNNMEHGQKDRVMDKKKLLEAAKSFLSRTSNIKKKTDNVSIQKIRNSINNRTLIRTPPTFNASTPWRSPDLVRNFNYELSPKQNLNNKSHKYIPSNYSYENDNLQSINLSNIENLHPENRNQIIETNPRKGLTYRTPLKNINILEVINLPTLSMESFYKYKSITPNSKDASPNIGKSENDSVADIFNLDDIMTDTDNNDRELEIPKKRNLNDKLKNLERLLPKKDSLSKPSRISLNTIKKIYKPNSPAKQKNIKEMFCSTMINENTPKDIDFTSDKTDDTHERTDEGVDETTNKNDDTDLHLFDDVAEASIFSLNSTMRTYSRPRKRKKMRHEFITCMSSESEEEENEHVHIKRTKKTDEQKKKNDEALENFYTEFNSVTDDVDKYELIVVPETD